MRIFPRDCSSQNHLIFNGRFVYLIFETIVMHNAAKIHASMQFLTMNQRHVLSITLAAIDLYVLLFLVTISMNEYLAHQMTQLIPDEG